jgi:hypothetical protein
MMKMGEEHQKAHFNKTASIHTDSPIERPYQMGTGWIGILDGYSERQKYLTE